MTVPPDVKLQDRALERSRNGLKAELRSLESSWNTLSPLNLLPVEILSYIFVLHSASLMNAAEASQNPASLERIRITHVCRHWREVALDVGELWSNILFTSPGIAELMLSRSKTAPLTIALKQGDSRLLALVLDILCSHPHRLSSVKVTKISNADTLKLLATSTPILQKLALRFQDLVLDDSFELSIPDLLRGNAPVLKHLEVLGFCIPHCDMLPIAPALTHLRLGSIRSTPTRRSGEALLRTLQQLPLLESLGLLGYVPAEPYPPSWTENPVECSSLRTLTVMDAVQPIQNFLNVIRIPQAFLHVIFTDEVDIHNDAPQFAAIIGKARSISSRLLLHTLAVSDRRREDCALTVDFCFHRKIENDRHDPGFSVTFQQPLPDNLQALVFTFIHTVVDPRIVLHLEMKSESWAFNRGAWIFFGITRYIKSIVFDGGADPWEFCTLLAINSGLPTNDLTQSTAESVPVFPSLATLSLEWSYLQEGSQLREVIVKALSKRPHPYRLKTLRVLHSSIESSGPGTAAYDFETSIPDVEVVWARD